MALRITAVLMLWAMGSTPLAHAEAEAPPDTGISGVYEVIVGVAEAEPTLDYFSEFGYETVATAELDANEAERLYGVDSAARVYRLQNGEIDTHGMLRVIEWADPLGPGVGYAPPETVGQRMAVMRTRDIFRIDDVFNDLRRESEEAWLPTPPVYDDLYDLDSGDYSISNRRVGVREMAVYGDVFNHVFFQRYGYTIPGYGTITDAPLQTSEFTHHDFMVAGDLNVVTAYYVDVLGFRSENTPSLDGDWLKGPKAVFEMENGEAHWYRGFVSPNNICGKLKFFSARDPGYVRDRSSNQRPGELGITLHSAYTPKLSMVHDLAVTHDLDPTPIQTNEFGEDSFVFAGPDGSTWQILEAPETRSSPVLDFELLSVAN